MTELRLVVDANVLLSGFLRDGATRERLLHAPLELYAPAWLDDEIERNLEDLCERGRLDRSVARTLLARFMDRIQTVPEPVLARHAAEAIARCRDSGIKNAPYIACALAVDASLWTRDRTLTKEAGVETYTTAELVDRFLP